jgi:hypothetical protein
VAHDCQKLVCDESGSPTNMPDPSDLPVDPTGGCNSPSCDGPTQLLTPTAAGTACTQMDKGVCNGAGVCGVCKPGATGCGTTTVQQLCNSSGAWEDHQTCAGACTNGVCTGTCNAGNYQPNCVGTTLQTCTANNIVGSACSYGCCNGACTGTCTPNTASCASGNKVTCDACGVATTSACPVATPFCQGGSCLSCQPGAVQCCANGNPGDKRVCDANGNWGACSPCGTASGATFTCANSGTTAISCRCSAPNPCVTNNWSCGNATDACGKAFSCGTCDPDLVCKVHNCSCPKICP